MLYLFHFTKDVEDWFGYSKLTFFCHKSARILIITLIII